MHGELRDDGAGYRLKHRPQLNTWSG